MAKKQTAVQLRRIALNRAIEWTQELIECHTPDEIRRSDPDFETDPEFEELIDQWKYQIAQWRKMLARL